MNNNGKRKKVFPIQASYSETGSQYGGGSSFFNNVHWFISGLALLTAIAAVVVAPIAYVKAKHAQKDINNLDPCENCGNVNSTAATTGSILFDNAFNTNITHTYGVQNLPCSINYQYSYQTNLTQGGFMIGTGPITIILTRVCNMITIESNPFTAHNGNSSNGDTIISATPVPDVFIAHTAAGFPFDGPWGHMYMNTNGTVYLGEWRVHHSGNVYYTLNTLGHNFGDGLVTLAQSSFAYPYLAVNG